VKQIQSNMTGSQQTLFTVTMDRLVYGGDAMGRLPDGRAIFVPYTLPGEEIRVRLVEEKRGHVRGELVEVLRPSPNRILPRYPQAEACGSCHYQHMPYELQLSTKAEILAEQLHRIARLKHPPVLPTLPSPRIWNYRNHIQLHVDHQGQLGYHEPRSKRVIPIHNDPLAEEPLNQLLPQLAVDPIPSLERISLRLGMDEDILLVLEANQPDAPDLSVEELDVSAVYLSPNGQLLMAGSDHVFMEAAGRAYKVSAQSFFQVNSQQASRMVTFLLEQLPLQPHMSVLELYSGVGLFSAHLAPRVARWVAVESSPSACADFVENLDEFDNVELFEAPVERTLSSLDIKPDLILADPPRSGLGSRVIPHILSSEAPLLAYISCDPATLARDARRLTEGGYRLEQATPIDMFPQTYHIESISLWRRTG
jgi:23S rRNA (uracil1939-C5)-methyltransferase